MSLTVLPSKTLSSGVPYRRPLNGFTAHRLTLVPAREPRRTGLAMLRWRRAADVTKGEPVAANVTDIAAYRRRRTVAMRTPAEQAKRRARLMMGMAAAAPPLMWVGHAMLHLARIL